MANDKHSKRTGHARDQEEKEESNLIKNYSILQNIIYVMQGVWKWKRSAVPLTLLNAITMVAKNFIIISIPKIVIDNIQTETVSTGGAEQRLFWSVLVIVLIQVLLIAVYNWTESNYFWQFIYVRVKYMLVHVKKSMTMDYEKLEQPQMLDLQEKAVRALYSNGEGIEGVMHKIKILLGNIFALILASTAILILNPWMVLVLSVLSICNFFFLYRAKVMGKIKHWDKMIPKWRRLDYLNNTTVDFAYAKDIRLFGMHRWLHKKQEEENAQAHKLFAEHYARWAGYATLMQIFTFLQELFLYSWLIHRVLYENLSIGNFALYILIARSFFDNAVSLFDTLSNFKEDSLKINDYRAFIEHPEKASVLSKCKELPLDGGYEFSFENVSFRYLGQTEYALKELNLTIKAGERLAVVGLNGAGKTTFIKLLCRLYEPTSGRILLNGIDIREFDRNAYFELISPVFQNVECYAFPISQNVSMKSPKKTDTLLAEKSIAMAGLDKKVKSLERGVHTELLKILHDDGIDLSGGEKQKLALARALYKDAPIIVLDEPTSALDALAEYKLYMDFNSLIGDKTAVFISHRLSSTRFCDSIAMFAGGQMIEYGTHEELLAKEGAYTELFQVQARYYKDKEVVCDAEARCEC